VSAAAVAVARTVALLGGAAVTVAADDTGVGGITLIVVGGVASDIALYKRHTCWQSPPATHNSASCNTSD